MIVSISCVENKGYIIRTGGEKESNKTMHLEGENLTKQNGLAKDYADNDDGEDDYDDYEEEEIHEETSSKKKKRKKGMYKSGVMLGKRLTEAEIIKYLKKEEPVTFQIRNKKELEKCSPFYYCSNEFMDKVCPPDPMFESPCRVTLHANGGDRGNQGRGKVIGTCKIDYFGCDPDSIDYGSEEDAIHPEIAEDTVNPSKDNKKDLGVGNVSENIKENEKAKKDEEIILRETNISKNRTENTKDEINANNFDEKVFDKRVQSESKVDPAKGHANDYKINYDNDYQPVSLGH